MFLDEATLDVKGGDGGKGAVAFRREKYVARGGPSGGHGGKGGDVILVGDEGLNTLHKFRFTQRYEGGRGGHGGGSNKAGKQGEDTRITVPVGTVVRDEATGEVIADIMEDGQEVVVARGGRGGRGNSAFKSATHQAPREAELGEPGEERRLSLELKLIADVGIIGLPNAGKSTLLAAVSGARPKIADYPFTTLVPNLGVVDLGWERLILADIPGLIEGASEGAGLGDRFLRHVERTRVLLHVIDGTADDPVASFDTINVELASFSPGLADRPQMVAVNKVDLTGVREDLPEVRKALRAAGAEAVMGISAVTGTNVSDLMEELARLVKELPEPEAVEADLPVIRPLEDDEDAFTIGREGEAWRVRGVRIERTAAMTDWSNEAAVRRFQRILSAMGIMDALRVAGIREGDDVRIGEWELEWVP